MLNRVKSTRIRKPSPCNLPYPSKKNIFLQAHQQEQSLLHTKGYTMRSNILQTPLQNFKLKAVVTLGDFSLLANLFLTIKYNYNILKGVPSLIY